MVKLNEASSPSPLDVSYQIIRCGSCMEEKTTGTIGWLGVQIVNVLNLHIW